MMPSAAEEQAQAIADVDRIARAFYEEAYATQYGVKAEPGWELLPGQPRNDTRAVVRELLRRDVIRVGRRPNVERPMTGQQSLMSHDRREALDEAREHRERDER